MTLTIRTVPDDPGILTSLFIDPSSGQLLALDDDGYDRMGLANRAKLRAFLREQDLLNTVPVYVDPAITCTPAPQQAPNI